MKRVIAIATCLMSSSTTLAVADPGTTACPVNGQPLIEIIQLDSRPHQPTVTRKLFDSGALIYDVAHEGVHGPRSIRCIDDSALAKARADLKAAGWKTRPPAIDCKARSTRTTVYEVNGKQVFEAHVCGDSLDEATAKAVHDIERLLGATP